MNAESAAILRTHRGTPVPLQGVSLAARAEGLLFELTVEQRYANVESEAIEAVYTFPLPLRAVLLSFELAIGERRLKGVVSAKRVAAETYERAIDDGDAAALLERAADGLYTVNLGNLKPGEHATITYRYAQLLDFEQGRVRLAIPTAIAPRYGAPDLDPHQVPHADLAVRYECTFVLELRGALAAACVSTPTHERHVELARGEGVAHLRSTRTFGLDRDLVVLVEDLPVLAPTVVARDLDGTTLAVASLVAPKLPERAAGPRVLKLVVDCSGSMQGDSIEQARTALLGVLSGLEARDRVSLTRFGTVHQHLTQGLERASAAALGRLAGVVRGLDADLGGTEMQSALRAVLDVPVAERGTADILLITDGEIWEVDAVVDAVACARHRLFVVAVGAAPNEALARRIAAATGGACEFVTPNEDMRGAVARLLARMGAPAARVERVEWPETPAWTLGDGAVVFPGDTVHVLAGFRGTPRGAVRVHVTGGERIDGVLPEHVAAEDALARVAAMRRLAGLERDAAAALAERYQLVTEHTSCVVVLERQAGEKAEGLPALRTVPQELAAGHGGVGTVRAAPFARMHVTVAAPAVVAMECIAPDRSAPSERSRWRKVSKLSFDALFGSEEADEGAGDDDLLATRLAERGPAPATIEELRVLGVEESVLAVLRDLVAEGMPEADVVAAWLAEYAESPAGSGVSMRAQVRLARAADRSVRRAIAARLAPAATR